MFLGPNQIHKIFPGTKMYLVMTKDNMPTSRPPNYHSLPTSTMLMSLLQPFLPTHTTLLFHLPLLKLI